jgi:hypothetical protein
MDKKQGLVKLILEHEEVLFYDMDGGIKEYKNLDDFLDADFGHKGATFYLPFEQMQAIYDYVEEEGKYAVHPIYISNYVKRVIGISVNVKSRFCMSKGKKKYYPFKTFYDIKYKIGSDEFKSDEALKMISEMNFTRYNQGFTSKLRNEIKLDETICRHTVNNLPSMAPIIYSSPLLEHYNVKCYDITSAYPYLLTQPLPHNHKVIKFESEKQLYEKGYTFYGGIKIKDIDAKYPYYPLTLVGKNNKGITIESQGINIEARGNQLIAADEVTLCGFLPDLLELLKRNYNYKSYRISPDIIKFELKIDKNLREKTLEYFEKKQELKRNNLPYSAEKVRLNRLYGFLITAGSNAPAHYGQYIVSQERLILDRIANKIGIRDVVHMHTDSIKFEGEHQDIIEEYNATIEFPELGRFALEDVFQKCVYFSHITAKYIDKEGKLGFKHGGIHDLGIRHLYKKTYDEIDFTTEFWLTTGFFYLKGEGYFPNGRISDFGHSVKEEDE